MILSADLLSWLFLGLVFWVAVLTTVLIQSIVHYRRLTKNIAKKDLKTILNQMLNQNETQGIKIEKIESAIAKINERIQLHIQKIGFVRFNPFPQTGGDQSFSLALLDENSSGFVLSSLHSRDNTRLYAKAVKKGAGDGYELSKEELKAIKLAK
jgi:hypothetical protein